MAAPGDDVPRVGFMSLRFFEHLEELRKRLRVAVGAFLAAFVFFMLFSFRYVIVLGVPMWLPLPILSLQEGIAIQFFVAIRAWLVPTNMNLVFLTLWDPVVVSFKVALFLAIVATSPISTYEFWRFVAPALRPKERRLVVRLSIPVVLLFLSGVVISILVVLPFTVRFLYGIAVAMGVQPFLDVPQFLDFVLLFTLGYGAAFELPVVMYGLSVLGVVGADFWKRHWRFATLAIFVFAAVITPDVSGVTMMIVAFPMLLLYVGGYIAIRLRDARLNRVGSAAKSS